MWEVKGRRFVAPDNLYQQSTVFIDEMTGHISDHLKLIHDTYFNEVNEDVVISFENSNGVDAIFYPVGTYKGIWPNLLQEKVIVINPRILSSHQLWRLLGHEYFHVIHNIKVPDEVSWIREGIAQKFEYELYGGVTQGNLKAAMDYSLHALEEDFDTSAPSAERYGNSFLFIRHLEEICGNDEVWRHFLELPVGINYGRASLEIVLNRLNNSSPDCANAKSIMGSFVLAKLINQRTETSARALWPLLMPMPVMRNEAESLARMHTVEQRRFFEALPPFLGMKLPTGVWTPISLNSMNKMGMKVFIFEETLPVSRLTPWNGSPITANPRRQILLYKSL